MEIIYLAILLCSIGFAIAAIYISLVLKRVADVTKSLGTTLKEVEQQLRYITPQLSSSIRETAKLVDDTGEKMKATDSIFDSIDNVGKSVQSLTEAYKTSTAKLNNEQFQESLKPIVEVLKWSEAVSQVFSKWKKRPTRRNEVMIREKTDIVPVNTGNEGY
ncbi:DUF948 domain-containing protein [Oceanobacillus chungangensis]|uniref:DUF948 domain-containing protein n=1 Tax=Oceanobacillus chungangensis TaxID=1229152 RepID=A0A3D8PR91_9BACI|nr:DUF948 domain-containing protein [Oceanobacillus chungangensis]RDW18623.1 DUF948 domain-containing protein [Oceanobacillus chungangensis]